MILFRRLPTEPPAAAERLADVLAEVRRIEVQSSRLVTDVLAGGYRSTFRGAGVEFSDVREYVEGDDPRSVDWNVTARIGRPFVKRFVEERELTVVFALDLSASMQAGFGAWSLAQTAARFCACLGLAAIANNDRVGLVAGSAGVERFVLPRKGAEKADLAELRRDICRRFLSNKATRVVEFDLPKRDTGTSSYLSSVDDWHASIATTYRDLLATALPRGGIAAFLIWGDPSLYDSTLRILERLRRGRAGHSGAGRARPRDRRRYLRRADRAGRAACAGRDLRPGRYD